MITSSSPRTRRRSSSMSLAVAVAAGLALCAGVADGFVAAPLAPAATVRGQQQQQQQQHARSLSTSTPAPPAVVLAPALSAVGVGAEGPRAEMDKPGLKFGCEDSWDCDGTQSCCDFVFFKMCCSEGTAAQEQWVPVPIPVRPNDGYPYPGSYR